MKKTSIVLKDGTEIENGSAARMDKRLMVSIPGNDIVNATVLLASPEKTETIVAYYSVYKKTFQFHGFTELYSIQYFDDRNEIQAWLRGENVSEESEYTVPEQYLPEEMRTKQ